MPKTALITGITGQDGSYLAEFLLEKSYKVVGLVSQKYNIGWQNVDHLKDKLKFEVGDLLEPASLEKTFKRHRPHEVYNLGGLTFVPKSWQEPTLTLDINLLGTSRLLEIIATKFPPTRFYQASTAKMFGDPEEVPQTETTRLNPLDPYSVSKAAAHLLTQAMRRQFGIFAVSGIMYNHESERRGPEFVTRKITQAAARIKLGLDTKLTLGNLDSKQDWGYAPDYVEAMWLMLQQDKPDDYIISTGKLHTVRDVCHIVFSHLGLDYSNFVTIDQALFRTTEAKTLTGDSTKARTKLGWKPRTTFKDMIIKMVEHDLKQLKTQSSKGKTTS